MQKIHSEIRRIDAEILAAVRQQVLGFTAIVFPFEAITGSIKGKLSD